MAIIVDLLVLEEEPFITERACCEGRGQHEIGNLELGTTVGLGAIPGPRLHNNGSRCDTHELIVEHYPILLLVREVDVACEFKLVGATDRVGTHRGTVLVIKSHIADTHVKGPFGGLGELLLDSRLLMGLIVSEGFDSVRHGGMEEVPGRRGVEAWHSHDVL